MQGYKQVYASTWRPAGAMEEEAAVAALTTELVAHERAAARTERVEQSATVSAAAVLAVSGSAQVCACSPRHPSCCALRAC